MIHGKVIGRPAVQLPGTGETRLGTRLGRGGNC